MGFEINSFDEFYEVLNAFPILKDRLERYNFDLSNVKEGESVIDFFSKKGLSEDEFDLFLKKLNYDIKIYLKKGNFPKTELKKEVEVLVISEEEE
jgi:hypothetical protein